MTVPPRRSGRFLLPLFALGLLAGCKPAPSTAGDTRVGDAKTGDAKADDTKTGDAKAEASAARETPAPELDLEALADDPTTALPGVLVRQGTISSGHSMHDGEIGISSQEEFTLYDAGELYVGRVTFESDNTPAPPWFLVFTMDSDHRLQHVIWRGLPSTSSIKHGFTRASMELDGTQVIVTIGSSAPTHTPVSGPWTMNRGDLLPHLPLLAMDLKAPPETFKWTSLSPTRDGVTTKTMTVVHQGEGKTKVGRQTVAAQRFHEHRPGKSSAPPIELWVDSDGLLLSRTATDEEDPDEPFGPTTWETWYEPKKGDALHRR